jgi:[ribosomal protein S5]-alanine N-acetyltransferase
MGHMPATAPPAPLVTERLVLRPRHAGEASVYRQLWTERDPRVPQHRQIDAEGRPSVADVASSTERGEQPGLLAVVRRLDTDVIGYCGLVFEADQVAGEAALAFELLKSAHGHGYATEAARAVVTWAAAAGYQRLWADVWDWNAASRRVLDSSASSRQVAGRPRHCSVSRCS